MEKEETIRLERSPANPGEEVLVGIDGDTFVSDRIARAVEASTRLFPYVVHHIAANILEGTDVGDRQRYDTIRSVRNELLTAVEGLKRVRAEEAQPQSRPAAGSQPRLVSLRPNGGKNKDGSPSPYF